MRKYANEQLFGGGLATLDDWQGIKRLYVRYMEDPSAKQGVHFTLDILQAHLANSLTMSHQVGMLVLRYGCSSEPQEVLAVALLFAVINPNLSIPGLQLENSTFIHSIYGVDRTDEGLILPKEPKKMFLGMIETWAHLRQAGYIFGNVHVERNWRAMCRVYGFQPLHVVVYKKLEGKL